MHNCQRSVVPGAIGLTRRTSHVTNMHTIIFANGHIPTSPLPLPAHDLLIAADGGAGNAAQFNLLPDVVIGDFDSLSPSEIAAFDQDGTKSIRYTAEKDETDLELAMDYAAGQGADEITLYGLLGGRWDMTFANLLLLASEKYAGIRFKAVDGNTSFHILHGGESLQLQGEPGDIVSVLPLRGPAEGVSYQGLTWPLEEANLPFGTPRGVSNTITDTLATISIQKGTVLVVHKTGAADY